MDAAFRLDPAAPATGALTTTVAALLALLAEQGQHGLATYSIGFDSAGGQSGDEYYYSDMVAKAFDTDHHKIHIDNSRLLPALPGVGATINGAYSLDCADTTGSLEPGKAMDAVLVHGDAINLIRVGAASIAAVIKGGQVAFGKLP